MSVLPERFQNKRKIYGLADFPENSRTQTFTLSGLQNSNNQIDRNVHFLMRMHCTVADSKIHIQWNLKILNPMGCFVITQTLSNGIPNF